MQTGIAFPARRCVLTTYSFRISRHLRCQFGAKLTFHISRQLPFMRLAEKTEAGLSAHRPRHRPSA